MKKLLSIIGVIGLGASAPAPLLANVPTVKQSEEKTTDTITIDGKEYSKKDILKIDGGFDFFFFDKQNNLWLGSQNNHFSLIKNSELLKPTPTIEKLTEFEKWDFASSEAPNNLILDNNNNIYMSTYTAIYKTSDKLIRPNKINGIDKKGNSIAVDKDNNLYYGSNDGVYKLSMGSDTPTKIDGIRGEINSLAVDSKNNLLVGKDDGIYKISLLNLSVSKLNEINERIVKIRIDKNDNIYFGTSDGAFVLKNGETTPAKINGISGYLEAFGFDKNNNIYLQNNYNGYLSKLIPYQTPPAPSNKLSSIAIAGIVIGSVAGVAFVVLGSCYLYQYLNKKKKANKK